MLLEKAYVADARSLESFKQRLWGECVRQGVEKVRRIMVLGDGAVWIGNTAIELFRFPDARDPTERPPPEVIRAVDWYHATEHVWAATELVHGTRDSEEAKRWVKHWETCLWEKGDAQGLAEEIQQKAADHRGERREDLVRAANYFRNNAEGMRYQKFREMGLPVGSGPVEGSCKFVAQSRCKKVGQRWLKDGLFGLADRPRSGRPRTADSRYLRQLRRAVRTLPRRLGFAFNVWSCGRLAVYLERKTGKRISGAHLATLLRAMNYRFRRPKHTLKGKRNELQHDRAYRKLQRLKRGLSSLPPVSPSGMATAASSTCGRTWLDCGNSAVPNSVSPLPVRIASSRSSGR